MFEGLHLAVPDEANMHSAAISATASPRRGRWSVSCPIRAKETFHLCPNLGNSYAAHTRMMLRTVNDFLKTTRGACHIVVQDRHVLSNRPEPSERSIAGEQADRRDLSTGGKVCRPGVVTDEQI